MPADKMHFRSLYVDPDVDKALQEQAAEAGVSEGEMFRTYLHKGLHSKRALALLLDAEVRLALSANNSPSLQRRQVVARPRS